MAPEELAARIKIDISNYRGSLYILEAHGKYYWAIECDWENVEDWVWKEIPLSLFSELIKHRGSPNAGVTDGW